MIWPRHMMIQILENVCNNPSTYVYDIEVSKENRAKNCSVRHKICVTLVCSSLILKANLIYTQETHLSPRQTNISVVVEVEPVAKISHLNLWLF